MTEVREQTVQQRPVEVLRSTPSLALIREGVRAGEQVVTDGYVRLRDGTKVVIQAAAAGKGSERAAADGLRGAVP